MTQPRGPPNTAATEPQVGTFAGGTQLNIPPTGRLDVYSGNGVVLQFTARLRLGGTLTVGLPLNAPGPSFDGRVFAALIPDTARPFVLWALVPQDTPPTFGQPGITQVNTVLITPTVVTSAAAVPQNLAAATVETVLATSGAGGSTGNLLRFVLSAEGVIATVADNLTYAAIKGTTTGTYYAVCYAPSTVAGVLRVIGTEAAFTIVARNQDTVAHGYSGSLVVTTGE